MLGRAVERGKPRLDYSDVRDGIRAPIYLRRMFGRNWRNEADNLVDRVLIGRISPSENQRRSDTFYIRAE